MGGLVFASFAARSVFSFPQIPICDIGSRVLLFSFRCVLVSHVILGC